MSFSHLFETYSHRQGQSPKNVAPLTPQFRSRVIMLCTQQFGIRKAGLKSKAFWEDVHEKLRFLVGRPQLTAKPFNRSVMADCIYFLQECVDEQFIDFIELIFRTEDYFRLENRHGANALIEEVNDFFRLDDLPYAVTTFVRETRTEVQFGREREASVVVSYPKVVRRDDEVTYTWAIEPALILLRDNQFTSANQEFLDALADFRKGDYRDCLAKCGSAFESTMKIICDRKGWGCSQNDTASRLLNVIFQNSGLEPSLFEQPLINIATLRNKLSIAHGAGTQQRNIPQHLAKYAINATAAAILLLVEECA